MCTSGTRTWFIIGELTRVSKLDDKPLILLVLVVVDDPHFDVSSSFNNNTHHASGLCADFLCVRMTVTTVVPSVN